MRYQEDKPVAKVLEWLEQQGAPIAQRTYQNFMTRVLRLMSLDQAKERDVNVDLLKAIRVRYKLAVDPKRGRVIAEKKAPWHLHRQRRRLILVGPKPKRVVKPTLQVSPPRSSKVKTAPVTTGTREKHIGYGDWKIINGEARAKLHDLDNKIMPNYDGFVIHLMTRKQYSPEELVALFNLTPNEAESCFMSFND